MKVLIFGASGSGTTTLAKKLAKRMDFVHLDSDDYYWKTTDPPFQEKIPLAEHNAKLKADFLKNENVILSGSMVSWGKEWKTAFDVAIFIRLDKKERMQRLKKREQERYGDRLLIDDQLRKSSKAFLEWARQYDNPNFGGRSIRLHKKWMQLLSCKVIEIDGATPLEIKINKVIEEVNYLTGNHS
nr:AAA family ATPase [Allomuricauda sp.]|tara:strand:- start:1798 stop:2352 length:555 start_codon:yes stop_codon:yes gene_type:complete